MARKSRLERVSTGIPGLDTVTYGGLLRGGLYTVAGPPGSGKTVFCTHMAFAVANRGDRVVYATLLSEAPARMLENCSSFEFFDDAKVGRELEYQSAFGTLQEEGPAGLLALLRQLVRKQRAKLLVIDSVLALEEVVGSGVEIRRFLRDLATQAGILKCTVLIVSPKPVFESISELTIAEGIISLDMKEVGMRTVRELEIVKFRGSHHLEGRHSFDIAPVGIVVYPRFESMFTRRPHPGPASTERVSTGSAELDGMLNGGLLRGSSTCLLGAPGTGKTGLCVHALTAAAAASQRSLYFGFNEPPERLLNRAADVGSDLRRARRSGLLEVLWHPPLELTLDALALRLMEAVERLRPSLVVIDGVEGFAVSAVYPERMSLFFVALTGELRARGITVIATAESESLDGPVQRPFAAVAASFDNILMLRYREEQNALGRRLAIIKTRESAFDPRERALEVGPHGLALQGDGTAEGKPKSAGRKRATAKRPRTRSSKER